MPSIEICLSNWVSSREMWHVHANEQINQYHHNSSTHPRRFQLVSACGTTKHNQPRQLLKLMSPREVANRFNFVQKPL